MRFNPNDYEEWIQRYKESFNAPIKNSGETWWEGERYKWVAIKHFQANWNIDSPDLTATLESALAKTENLLTSANSFPRGMILNFAQAAPEEVRSMFVDLFNESEDVVERIERFKHRAEQLRAAYMPGAKNHYQSENTISTYLWLRYPDKYYIYKLGEVREAAKHLGSDLVFKKGRYEENLRNFYELYDEINEQMRKDASLRDMLDADLDADCYPDADEKTLTADFGFFISRMSKEQSEETQSRTDYPGLSVEEWSELIKDNSVFDVPSLSIMKRILDMGGSATCSELSERYGEHWNWYNSKSQALASRVIKASGIELLKREDGSSLLWPVLYEGENADKDANGVFIWTLHKNLRAALEEADLSAVPLSSAAADRETNHWWLNANPKIWSFAETPVGEVQSYTLLNENGNKRRIYQNFLNAKPGDTVIGYESAPAKQIVALGRIVEGSDGEKITFVKEEALGSPIDYQTLKAIPELSEMEFFVNPNGSLFKVTPEEQEAIMDLVREANPIPDSESTEPYTRKDFLDEVFITESEYEKLASLLLRKKNLIIQGAPGTGKTFAAKRLAYALMEAVDDDRIELVQFHQNYSYEDFVMGFRPTEDGFELRNGIFFRFCQRAASKPDEEFFFIIDEINRGNVSKIFGELLMLIEDSHRGDTVTLAYNGMPFSVPKNLYIIGMMNTADRSLALIDYALRRRFAFYEMSPALQSEGFLEELASYDSESLNKLVAQVALLNEEIASDRSLGRGFQIGHSYFCGLSDTTSATLRSIVDTEIVPMLEEYWFDDEEKVRSWHKALKAAIE